MSMVIPIIIYNIFVSISTSYNTIQHGIHSILYIPAYMNAIRIGTKPSEMHISKLYFSM